MITLHLPGEWAFETWVPGRSVTKGSTRSFIRKGKIVTVADNDRDQDDWKILVRHQVRQAWARRPITTDAVIVELGFVLPRRATAPKTFTPHHTRKPDVDKLMRMILDVMTGLVYADDGQVITGIPSKREAEIGEEPGVRIRLAVLEPVGRPARPSTRNTPRSPRSRVATGGEDGNPDAP